MVEYDAFRKDLANSLLRCAEIRRRSRAGGALNGEDIKIVALLEGLAMDVKNLDLHVFLIFELMFTHKRLARQYLRRHDDLLAQLGVTYRPTSATDLVRWMTHHTMDDALDGGAPRPLRRPQVEGWSSPGRIREGQRGPVIGDRPGLPLSLAVNFIAGFSILAPCLSLWNIRTAFGQLHDRSLMADHAAVPATVTSVKAVTASRSSGIGSDVVLSFRQPSGEACTATWHTGIPAFSGAPGDTVMVVPRSASCEMPLIPLDVGDPMQTFALAAALMAGGLASIKLWSWLSRRSPRPATPSVWPVTAEQRNDLT